MKDEGFRGLSLCGFLEGDRLGRLEGGVYYYSKEWTL